MVFITGSTGFIGAHTLCEFLLRGKKVKALRRTTSSMHELEMIAEYRCGKKLEEFAHLIEWCEGDVCDIVLLDKILQGIDTVIHCAATVSFSKSDAERMNQINVEGTANMVNAALKNGVRRFVHLSSTSALSKHDPSGWINEGSDYLLGEENSRYGISKFRAEMEVWRGIEEGLHAVILNPCVVLGFGDWDKGSCKLFKQYANGFPFVSTGSNAFVGVRDVSQILYKLAENQIVGERFLCVSENMAFKDLFDQMALAFGEKPAPILINKLKSEVAWRLFSVVNLFTSKPLITKESAKASVESRKYSNQKIKEALDFEFMPISQVVQEAAEAYSENALK